MVTVMRSVTASRLVMDTQSAMAIAIGDCRSANEIPSGRLRRLI